MSSAMRKTNDEWPGLPSRPRLLSLSSLLLVVVVLLLPLPLPAPLDASRSRSTDARFISSPGGPSNSSDGLHAALLHARTQKMNGPEIFRRGTYR